MNELTIHLPVFDLQALTFFLVVHCVCWLFIWKKKRCASVYDDNKVVTVRFVLEEQESESDVRRAEGVETNTTGGS